ncbi:MAG TPA: hypothetical protein EYG02_00955 [Henriciella marina]|uniref:hypothetical protein n=1 Tax=Henriciella sp. TaxID=1968823 RepID=UPI0017E5DB7B|nr:hypothetical protein [Henriciella sp.]HIG24169.1 hypothetical protein [Henriciella sp.]HIK63581.1 hypothetical protein [Henriciella marina]
MKRISLGATLVLSTYLTACDNPPRVPELRQGDGLSGPETSEGGVSGSTGWSENFAAFEAFEAEAYADPDSSEADLSEIQGLLPDFVSVSWDEQSYDETTGATAFENLRITINTEPAFGVAMDEARVWGFEDDLLIARLNGERFEETGRVFDRLEADGYSLFGAAGAMEAVFDVMEAQMGADAPSEVAFGVNQFDMTVESTVTGPLTLRPFEYVPLSDEQYAQLTGMLEIETEDLEAEGTDGLQVLRLAQQVIAVGRAVEIERGSARNMEMTLEIDTPEVSQSVSYTLDFYGYEGLSGYDMGGIYYSGMRQQQGMSFDGEALEAEGVYPDGLNVDQLVTADYMSYEDIRLDTLAGFLARSEFPGLDQRDLISLGQSVVSNYSYQLGGSDVFRVAEMSVKADEFEWLLPEAISVDMQGVAVYPGEIGETVLSFLPSGEDEEMEAVRSDIAAGIDLLDEHGLSEIPADIQTAMTWNKDSGETEFSFAAQAEGFGERIARLGITLPPYDPIAAAAEQGELDSAFEGLFETHFSFNGARLYESDDGGYDKLFAYLHALGQQHESEGWGATLAGMPPEDLRQFIAVMTRSAKGRVQDQFPQAVDWIEAVAAYFETSGGSLDIRLDPPSPLTPDDIEELARANDMEAWVEQFGISVTHTPE